MKAINTVPVSKTVIIALLIANLAWMSWNLYQHADARSVAKHFKIEVLHTNDDSGIGLFDARTEQPVWSEWDFGGTGKPNQENFYFRGHDVFDIVLKRNRPPIYSVRFLGSGKSETWWTDRGGSGSFTERIFYNTNGVFSKHEIWYGQTWYPVDDKKRGIFVNGHWLRLSLDTNGVWAADLSNN